MVVLKLPVESWPAGTQGTIVDAFEDEAVVEITAEDGSALAMLSVPYADLVLLPALQQKKLAF